MDEGLLPLAVSLLDRDVVPMSLCERQREETLVVDARITLSATNDGFGVVLPAAAAGTVTA